MSQQELTHERSRTLSRLLTQLYRKRRSYMNGKLAHTGLKGPMYTLLLTLDRFPDSSQDFVANHVGIDKSGIARAARELETLGYISRETDDENRRRVRMNLTEKGRQQVPAIRGYMSEWCDMITQGLGDSEVDAIVAAMELMSKNAGE